MHAWFSPLFEDFNSKQEKTYKITARQDGLACRILESDKYQSWLHKSGSTLWCLGAQGIGKTVLASFIIQSLHQQGNSGIGLGFVYCNYSESNKHTAENFMGVVLQQLSLQSTQIADELTSCFEAHRQTKTRPSFEELSRLFQSASGFMPRLYLVLDGVDECPTDTRDLIFREIQKLYPAFSLFITSRHAISTLSAFRYEMSIEITADEEDIKSYLEDRIDLSAVLRTHCIKDSELHKQIVDNISTKAKGM